MRRDDDDVAYCGDKHAYHDMEAAFAGSRAVVRYEQDSQQRREPDGHGEQQRLRCAVTEAVDDRWEEVPVVVVSIETSYFEPLELT